MKPNKKSIAVLLAAVMMLSTSLVAADYVPGELVVKVEKGLIDFKGFNETSFSTVSIANQRFAQALSAYQPRSMERVFKGVFATPPFRFTTNQGLEVQLEDLSQVYLLKVDPAVDIESAARELSKVPGVFYAEPNYILHLFSQKPNDPTFPSQWGLENTLPGYEEWDISARKSWSIETGEQTIKLAILDSGMEPEHYDDPGDEFYNRIFSIQNFSRYSLYGTTDMDGHGTHTAGIAAASTDNGDPVIEETGTAGVAGGWNTQGGVKLIIAKVAEFEQTTLDDVLAGIEWATAQGADVMNCSWGIPDNSSKALRDAFTNAFLSNVSVFISSGNYPPGTSAVNCPAIYSIFDICSAVGAMTNHGERANFSCYGPQLSFVAPGAGIWSTTNDYYSYYVSWNGTSMSSPMAAGAASLLCSAASNTGCALLDVDCKRIMEKTARHNDEDYGNIEWDEETGYGCVDAWEAVRHLYWPYAIEHRTVPHSQLTQSMVGYQKVSFVDDQTGQISAGEYWCDKYELTGSVAFTSSFQETPWFWNRILSVQTGYSGNNPCPGVYDVNVTNLTASSASFKTYAYLVKYDAVGNVINKWVPCNPANIQVAITALGPTATLSSHYATVSSNNYGSYSDVAVDNVRPEVPNDVYVSFYDTKDGDLRCVKDNFTGFTENELVDATGNVGLYSSIALDPQGYPHIAYYDQTNNMAKHAWKDGGSPSWHVELTADQLPNFGGLYTSIAIDDAGLVQGCAYTTRAAQASPYTWNGWDLTWFCRIGGTPHAWIAEPVDITGDVGKYCAIALDAGGNPHISYYDETNTNLKYATRTGGANPIWVTTTVDNSGNVGKYTSIAVDKLGNPHISYYDETNGRLKYAHKDASGWHTETVGLGSDDWGISTSICIDDDGRPVITYGYDSYGVYSAKKSDRGWIFKIIDNSASEDAGTSVAIDNLGRMTVTYQKANKLYVSRSMRWSQESDYGLLTSNNAGIEEESIQIKPAITSVIANETPGKVSISYSLPTAANIQMLVYDVSGREVKTLYSGQQTPGSHQLVWDGVDNQGYKIPRGVYFVRMLNDGTQISKKVTILR